VMSIDLKQKAAANSAEDTKNGKGGDALGEALKDEDREKGPVDGRLFKKSMVPLFMRGSSEGTQGNAQDEKDATEE